MYKYLPELWPLLCYLISCVILKVILVEYNDVQEEVGDMMAYQEVRENGYISDEDEILGVEAEGRKGIKWRNRMQESFFYINKPICIHKQN